MTVRRDAPGWDGVEALFRPFRLNDGLELPNRIVLAPCTRSRAEPDLAPTVGAIRHYEARAAAGLLVSEGVIVDRAVQGYKDTPGMFLERHVERWAAVTERVHAAGGRIFMQIWHPGRMTHSHWSGTPPLAPSVVVDALQMRTTRGPPLWNQEPRAMTGHEISAAIAQFDRAAGMAKRAGFDGLEIHGANGYLQEQFMRAHTNRRTDDWGGSITNRIRFALETFYACAAHFGPGRVGYRLSPAAYFSEMRWHPSDNEAYLALFDAFNRLRPAYVHVGVVCDDPYPELGGTCSAFVRRHFRGPVIGNGGYTPAGAAAAIIQGCCDAVAFGRQFLANPDLVARIADRRDFIPYGRTVIDVME